MHSVGTGNQIRRASPPCLTLTIPILSSRFRRVLAPMIKHIRLSKSRFLMTIQGLYDPFATSKVLSHVSKPTKTLKQKVIKAYGGKCECCGISEHDFLTIDHIYRDGKEDRKKHGAGSNFYRVLEKMGYPKDRYRLLCMNCNFVQRYGNPCPHSLKLRSNSIVKSVKTDLKARKLPSLILSVPEISRQDNGQVDAQIANLERTVL